MPLQRNLEFNDASLERKNRRPYFTPEERNDVNIIRTLVEELENQIQKNHVEGIDAFSHDALTQTLPTLNNIEKNLENGRDKDMVTNLIDRLENAIPERIKDDFEKGKEN